jgi:hypothetical protein
MIDIVLLEDNQFTLKILKHEFEGLKNIRYTITEDSRSFRAQLRGGNRADYYFLDDEVPDLDGRVNFQFIDHHTMLLLEQPDAVAFYTGSVPGDKERAYCGQKGIRMIEKADIIDILEELSGNGR